MAEHQGRTDGGAAGGVGVADDGLGGVTGGVEAFDNGAVFAGHFCFGVDDEAAGGSDVTGVDLGGVEGALLHGAQGRVGLVVAVAVEPVVFVFATVEVFVDAGLGVAVEGVDGLLQLVDRHVDLAG